MSSKDPDREIARLFEEQRRADEASAPAFRELLGRPRSSRAPLTRWIWRPALAGAVVTIVTLLLHRPPQRHVPESELPATAATLTAWKAPTNVLLQTPGAELLGRLPVLVSPAPETALAAPQR